MKEFILHWFGGTSDVVYGECIADAFRRAGYGGGAISALDYYEEVKKKSVSYKLFHCNILSDFCFRSLDEMRGMGKGDPSKTDYDMVYQGEIQVNEDFTIDDILDKIFEVHNMPNRPMAKQIRSMSVSDIVELAENGDSKQYYCCSVGFLPVKIL